MNMTANGNRSGGKKWNQSARRSLCVFLVVLLWFGFSCNARAEIAVASSVEWLTCDSVLVVRGAIKEIRSSGSSYMDAALECVISVAECLKGTPPVGELTFLCRDDYEGEAYGVRSLAKSGHEALLFLKMTNERDYPQTPQLHNRLTLASSGVPFSAFDLQELSSHRYLYSKDMTILRDREQLLGIVREWAGSTVRQSLRREVPYESEVFKKLYARSACYLTVPAEEKYRQEFLRQAGSPEQHERAHAAYELSKYPGADTEAVLYALLDDVSLNIWYQDDTIDRYEYQVRSAAFHSLQALGKPVKELPLTREATYEEKRQSRENYWRKRFRELLAKEGEILSVQDGRSIMLEDKPRIRVDVGFSAIGGDVCTFVLIPKEWKNADHPE